MSAGSGSDRRDLRSRSRRAGTRERRRARVRPPACATSPVDRSALRSRGSHCRAEKAGEHGHRNAVSTLAFLTAPERSGVAGREERGHGMTNTKAFIAREGGRSALKAKHDYVAQDWMPRFRGHYAVD